jgi:protein-S-isoprenylcysteine O-methyltransferase Ste14
VNRRIPPLALTLLLLAAAWLCARALPQLALGVPGAVAIGALVAGLGLLVCGAGVVSFRRAGTTVDPRTPERASSLVCGGIYRVSRNPMYLGFLLLIAGWGLLLDNLAALLPFPAGFAAYIDRYQIPREERALLDRFGDEFAAYMSEVRRWL